MTKKTLHNSDDNHTERNVPDVNKWGNVDAWQLICKASSEKEGWMKSTKAMEVGHFSLTGRPLGCLVQVTTQQRNPDGSYSVAEAITFVPGAAVGEVRTQPNNVLKRRELIDIGDMKLSEEPPNGQSYCGPSDRDGIPVDEV